MSINNWMFLEKLATKKTNKKNLEREFIGCNRNVRLKKQPSTCY